MRASVGANGRGCASQVAFGIGYRGTGVLSCRQSVSWSAFCVRANHASVLRLTGSVVMTWPLGIPCRATGRLGRATVERSQRGSFGQVDQQVNFTLVVSQGQGTMHGLLRRGADAFGGSLTCQ